MWEGRDECRRGGEGVCGRGEEVCGRGEEGVWSEGCVRGSVGGREECGRGERVCGQEVWEEGMAGRC